MGTMQPDTLGDGGKDAAGAIAWAPYAFAGFVVGTAYFVVTRLASLWSGSIDLALHCVLVARLMSGEQIAGVDPTMDEMVIYPRVSHTIAAIIGAMFDSPVVGLHVVSLVSLIVLWGLIAWGMMGAGKRAGVLLPAFFVLMFLNSRFVHAEIFGNEIVGNYFFSQLVGQTLAILVLLLAGNFEKRGVLPEVRYLFLGLCVPALTSVHLIPALEIAGVLAASVVVECFVDWRLLRAIAGGIALILAALLTLKNVDFWSMVWLSENNGVLNIRYVRGVGGAVVLAVATLAISSALLYRWTRSDPARPSDRLFLKYLALFGLACASLCLVQYLMLLLFDLGSEYAVKKYAFGLDTTLLLMTAYAIAAVVARSATGWLRHRAVAPACVALIPLLFVVSPQFKAARSAIDAARLTSLERLLRHYRDLALEPQANKSDYAMGIGGLTPTGDYLLSIVALHAPQLPNAYAIIVAAPLPEPDQVGFIFTSEHSLPWDIPSCRRRTFPNSIVQLDGSCVFAAVQSGSQ